MSRAVLKSEMFDRSSQVQSVTLVDGEFSPEDAKTHVLGMLSKSINHHWIQSFNQHEKTGTSGAYSDLKMADLSLSRSELAEFLEEAEKNGLKLNIDAQLTVSIA